MLEAARSVELALAGALGRNRTVISPFGGGYPIR